MGIVRPEVDLPGETREIPDLDPTVETRPSLSLMFARPSDTATLKLPVRSVIATDLGGAGPAGRGFDSCRGR